MDGNSQDALYKEAVFEEYVIEEGAEFVLEREFNETMDVIER